LAWLFPFYFSFCLFKQACLQIGLICILANKRANSFLVGKFALNFWKLAKFVL
jgi:hypothetical protein